MGAKKRQRTKGSGRSTDIALLEMFDPAYPLNVVRKPKRKKKPARKRPTVADVEAVVKEMDRWRRKAEYHATEEVEARTRATRAEAKLEVVERQHHEIRKENDGLRAELADWRSRPSLTPVAGIPAKAEALAEIHRLNDELETVKRAFREKVANIEPARELDRETAAGVARRWEENVERRLAALEATQLDLTPARP